MRPFYAKRPLAQGWKIRCLPVMQKQDKGAFGVADINNKEIRIWALTDEDAKAFNQDRMVIVRKVIAHEWAHAESASWGEPGYSFTKYWVKITGYTPVSADTFWNYSGSKINPAELYAETRAHCAGYGPNFPHELTSCSKINQLVHYINTHPKG